MKQAFNSYNETKNSWNGFLDHINAHRSNEKDIRTYGYMGPEIKDLGIPWAIWEEQFSLEDKSVDASFERKLVQHLNSMRDRLNEARNNGVPWLLNNSSFLYDAAEINQICFCVIPPLRGSGKSLKNFKLDEARLIAAESVALKNKVEEKLKWVGEQEGIIKRVSETANSTISDVENAKKSLIDTTSKLNKSQADLNKHGMAGAFAAAARKFTIQRVIFGFGFFLALGGIACIGISSEAALGSIGENFAFVGALGKAAPFVWLGWFSVRQLGQMTRVQQDYEFKTATALAFEAHKKEIIENDEADRELTKHFLKAVISNFGDNPVRLLPNSKNEYGHPIEELITKVSDDKTFDRLVKVFDSLKGK